MPTLPQDRYARRFQLRIHENKMEVYFNGKLFMRKLKNFYEQEMTWRLQGWQIEWIDEAP